MKYTVFISDLHLSEQHPELLQSFQHLLEQHQQADALYILGDFFDYWIGDDAMTEFHHKVVKLLRRYHETLPIHIMHGNRDFLLGDAFYQASGCKPLRDPDTIDCYGQTITLLHGDSLCTDQGLYGLYRSLARNRFVQSCFLSLPVKLRQAVALYLRGNHGDHDESKARDVSQPLLNRWLEQTKPQLLIHGHSHYPVIDLRFKPICCQRYVLRAWGPNANQLIINENHQFRLEVCDY